MPQSRSEIALFIPCIVRDFLPEVGRACLTVLDRLGARTAVPQGQTCCGQPEYKRGQGAKAVPLARRILDLFEGYEAVVAPSGSCVSMIRHYPDLLGHDLEARKRAEDLAARTFEFSQYLVDELGVDDLGAEFPARAVYHDSCQVGRSLGVFEQPNRLLAKVRGLELLPLEDQDRCCGLGGTFGLDFPEVSEVLLEDKGQAILDSGADTVVTAEPSCLLNLRGHCQKLGLPVRVMHLAEVLASGPGQGSGS